MNGSSDEVLAGVGPGQIRLLLEILRDSAWRSRSFVEGRFRDQAKNFAGTLAFLQCLGWVQDEDGQLRTTETVIERALGDNAEHAAVSLLEALLDSSGPHQHAFDRYLLRFHGSGEKATYAARGELDLADAPVRDFLMELGAIRHEPSRREYVLQRPFLGAYLWALARRGPESSAEMLHNLDQRQRLGRDAEIAVVEFEHRRLGTRWANRVQHVSAKHPTAPFDIKSLTVTNGQVKPRYIEVKAVSATLPEFHWSTAEIEAARLLREEYCLYLVPVRALEGIDVERVQIISDPHSEIYSHSEMWEKVPTSFLCRPARA